jgi:hypothetical protein
MEGDLIWGATLNGDSEDLFRAGSIGVKKDKVSIS